MSSNNTGHEYTLLLFLALFSGSLTVPPQAPGRSVRSRHPLRDREFPRAGFAGRPAAKARFRQTFAPTGFLPDPHLLGLDLANLPRQYFLPRSRATGAGHAQSFGPGAH